jgi:nucleotide-binding universal stress UspA family protein
MKLPLATTPSKAPPAGAAANPSASIQLKTILAAADFSDESLAGVRYAVALAGKSGSAVTLLHVVEPPSRLAGMEMVPLARTDEEVAALARAELATLAERETADGVHPTACVRIGKPFHEIATAAREQAADLLVIASHGRSGWQRVLLGSTAERVVRHAPCPVLTVPARAPLPPTSPAVPLRIKRILVPLDFSTVSEAALPWATFLAEHCQAELVLLHVTEQFPLDYLLGRELTDSTVAPLMKQATTNLQRIAGSLGKPTGRNASVVVCTGSPFEEICGAAQTLGADLIVLTTHGYTGLKHVWLGSTAERVVRNACCPVLTVRASN